jgi:hypothetical protein
MRETRAAFTVLEVMLAVTILALVVTTVYTTWNAALTAWRRGTESSDTFQRQRVVMEALSELARSAVFFSAHADLYEVVGTHEGTGRDSVSFVTASDLLLPPSDMVLAGMRRVTIAMQQDRYGRNYLGIANAPALEATGDQAEKPTFYALSTDVSGFVVRYRDPRDNSWHDDWQDTAVPAAIEFTVVFRDKRPGATPVIVTQAVDFPAARFALESSGIPMNQQDTTNEVTRRELDLSKLGSDDSGSAASEGDQ